MSLAFFILINKHTQNDIRVRVTRYLDDIVVRAPRYTIREIDLSLSLSRIQWVYTCVLVRMIILVLRRGNSIKKGSTCSDSERKKKVEIST